MSSETEIAVAQKAAFYDILQILRENRTNESSYTEKEFSYKDLETLFDAYLAGKKG